jgi:hypothetical protein
MATKRYCKVCGREAIYTEIVLIHDSYQVIGISYACEEHVEAPGRDTVGREVVIVPQILSRQDAQFFVYEWNFAN